MVDGQMVEVQVTQMMTSPSSSSSECRDQYTERSRSVVPAKFVYTEASFRRWVSRIDVRFIPYKGLKGPHISAICRIGRRLQ